MTHVMDPLVGKHVWSAALNDDGELVVEFMEGGTPAVFRPEGDCCSSTWIEHLTVPRGIRGAAITAVKDAEGTDPTPEEEAQHECLAVYASAIVTDKGEIVVEYRNSSNGYYGGFLTLVLPAPVILEGTARVVNPLRLGKG